MTDTRLSETWLLQRNMRDLSDSAWRLFTTALMWCNLQLSDGEIPAHELRMLHRDPSDDDIAELISAGLWVRDGGSFRFDAWDKGLGQSTRKQVELNREHARLRKAKQRENEKKKVAEAIAKLEGTPTPVTRDVTMNVTRDVTPGVGQDRKGQDRQVPEGVSSNVIPMKRDENEVSWPVVSVPGEEWSSSDEKAF